MARPKGSKTKKPNAKKTGPRFTLTEKEVLKAEIARLDAMGYNTVEIAEKVNTSRPTVSSCLKEIQDDYHAAYIDNRRMWAMKEFATIMDVRKRAYEEIAALKERGKRKKTTRSGSSEKGAYDEEAETVEDPELLGWHRLVKDTVQDVMDLLGLRDLPAQVLVQINNQPNLFQQMQESLLAALDAQERAKGIEDLPAAETVEEKEK